MQHHKYFTIHLRPALFRANPQRVVVISYRRFETIYGSHPQGDDETP